jgi:hypothetical protein
VRRTILWSDELDQAITERAQALESTPSELVTKLLEGIFGDDPEARAKMLDRVDAAAPSRAPRTSV